MLRINLLPAYVAQRRVTARLRVAFIAAFIVIVVGMLAWNSILIKEVGDETALAQSAVSAHQTIDALNTKASGILAQIGPITNKVDFYNAVMKSNTEIPDLYSDIARWTSPAIYYTDMSVSGNILDIKGYTKSIADLNRYLQYMYTEPDVVNVGLVSSLPNYSQAVEKVTLYKGQPIDVGGQQGMGGGGRQGFGPPPGFGGPQGAFGGPPGMGPNGPGPGAFGAPGGAGAPNQQALLDPGLANAMATGAGTTTGYKHVDSFTFEVQCTLKKPIAVPGDPGTGAGGGGAAGGASAMPAMGGA